MHTPTLLALDIGGTKVAAAFAEPNQFGSTGRLQRLWKENVPGNGTPGEVLSSMLSAIRSIVQEEGFVIKEIGISIGGPLDHTTGTVINFPHLPGWKNIPLTEIISRGLDAPSAMDNDANLGALAEHRWGEGRGYDDVVYMTISTGIGGGIIAGGVLLHGIGSGAGEVGHITVQTDGPLCPCGNRGCLERMASGTNIARHAREMLSDRTATERGKILLTMANGNPDAITAELVYGAMQAGDEIAREVWTSATEYLAIGIAGIIHIVAPQIIILGGGVAQAGDALLGPVRDGLRRHVFYIPVDSIRLATAKLGHDSALIGAATLAFDNLGARPYGGA